MAGDLQSQLDAKLGELINAEQAVIASYQSSGSALFTVVGGNVGDYITQAQNAIDLLQGALYQAALGQAPFPLDTGTQVDQVGALAAWNQLAASTQNLLSQTLHWTGTWGPLPFLAQVGQDLVNPTKWPWWLQAAAGAAIVYYASKVLGAAGEAKRAFQGYRGRRRMGSLKDPEDRTDLIRAEHQALKRSEHELQQLQHRGVLPFWAKGFGMDRRQATQHAKKLVREHREKIAAWSKETALARKRLSA